MAKDDSDERKLKQLQSFTSCSPEQGRAALERCVGDVNKAATYILSEKDEIFESSNDNLANTDNPPGSPQPQGANGDREFIHNRGIAPSYDSTSQEVAMKLTCNICDVIRERILSEESYSFELAYSAMHNVVQRIAVLQGDLRSAEEEIQLFIAQCALHIVETTLSEPFQIFSPASPILTQEESIVMLLNNCIVLAKLLLVDPDDALSIELGLHMLVTVLQPEAELYTNFLPNLSPKVVALVSGECDTLRDVWSLFSLARLHVLLQGILWKTSWLEITSAPPSVRLSQKIQLYWPGTTGTRRILYISRFMLDSVEKVEIQSSIVSLLENLSASQEPMKREDSLQVVFSELKSIALDHHGDCQEGSSSSQWKAPACSPPWQRWKVFHEWWLSKVCLRLCESTNLEQRLFGLSMIERLLSHQSKFQGPRRSLAVKLLTDYDFMSMLYNPDHLHEQVLKRGLSVLRQITMASHAWKYNRIVGNWLVIIWTTSLGRHEQGVLFEHIMAICEHVSQLKERQKAKLAQKRGGVLTTDEYPGVGRASVASSVDDSDEPEECMSGQEYEPLKQKDGDVSEFKFDPFAFARLQQLDVQVVDPTLRLSRDGTTLARSPEYLFTRLLNKILEVTQQNIQVGRKEVPRLFQALERKGQLAALFEAGSIELTCQVLWICCLGLFVVRDEFENAHAGSSKTSMGAVSSEPQHGDLLIRFLVSVITFPATSKLYDCYLFAMISLMSKQFECWEQAEKLTSTGQNATIIPTIIEKQIQLVKVLLMLFQERSVDDSENISGKHGGTTTMKDASVNEVGSDTEMTVEKMDAGSTSLVQILRKVDQEQNFLDLLMKNLCALIRVVLSESEPPPLSASLLELLLELFVLVVHKSQLIVPRNRLEHILELLCTPGTLSVRRFQLGMSTLLSLGFPNSPFGIFKTPSNVTSCRQGLTLDYYTQIFSRFLLPLVRRHLEGQSQETEFSQGAGELFECFFAFLAKVNSPTVQMDDAGNITKVSAPKLVHQDLLIELALSQKLDTSVAQRVIRKLVQLMRMMNSEHCAQLLKEILTRYLNSIAKCHQGMEILKENSSSAQAVDNRWQSQLETLARRMSRILDALSVLTNCSPFWINRGSLGTWTSSDPTRKGNDESAPCTSLLASKLLGTWRHQRRSGKSTMDYVLASHREMANNEMFKINCVFELEHANADDLEQSFTERLGTVVVHTTPTTPLCKLWDLLADHVTEEYHDISFSSVRERQFILVHDNNRLRVHSSKLWQVALRSFNIMNSCTIRVIIPPMQDKSLLNHASFVYVEHLLCLDAVFVHQCHSLLSILSGTPFQNPNLGAKALQVQIWHFLVKLPRVVQILQASFDKTYGGAAQWGHILSSSPSTYSRVVYVLQAMASDADGGRLENFGISSYTKQDLLKDTSQCLLIFTDHSGVPSFRKFQELNSNFPSKLAGLRASLALYRFVLKEITMATGGESQRVNPSSPAPKRLKVQEEGGSIAAAITPSGMRQIMQVLLKVLSYIRENQNLIPNDPDETPSESEEEEESSTTASMEWMRQSEKKSDSDSDEAMVRSESAFNHLMVAKDACSLATTMLSLELFSDIKPESELLILQLCEFLKDCKNETIRTGLFHDLDQFLSTVHSRATQFVMLNQILRCLQQISKQPHIPGNLDPFFQLLNLTIEKTQQGRKQELRRNVSEDAKENAGHIIAEKEEYEHARNTILCLLSCIEEVLGKPMNSKNISESLEPFVLGCLSGIESLLRVWDLGLPEIERTLRLCHMLVFQTPTEETPSFWPLAADSERVLVKVLGILSFLCSSEARNSQVVLFVHGSVLSELKGYVQKVTPLAHWRTRPDRIVCSSAQFVGLVNPGSTCYMNSVLQQFFMSPWLRSAVLSAPTRGSTDMTDMEGSRSKPVLKRALGTAMKQMFRYMEISRLRAYNAFQVVEAARVLELSNDVFQQNDAQEFCSKLVDCLDDPDGTADGNGRFGEFLGGQISHVNLKKGCPHGPTMRVEDFVCLELQIKGHRAITDSLNEMVQGEILDGENKVECDQCRTKYPVLRRDVVSRLPKVLILHLKRFDLDYTTFETVKLDNYCSFPHLLDMSPFMDQREGGTSQSKKFRLSGVVIHRGVAGGGHYFSISRDRSTGKWYKFNDESVTPYDPKNIPFDCFGQQHSTTDVGSEDSMGNLQSDDEGVELGQGGDEVASGNGGDGSSARIRGSIASNAYLLFYESCSETELRHIEKDSLQEEDTNSKALGAKNNLEENMCINSEVGVAAPSLSEKNKPAERENEANSNDDGAKVEIEDDLQDDAMSGLIEMDVLKINTMVLRQSVLCNSHLLQFILDLDKLERSLSNNPLHLGRFGNIVLTLFLDVISHTSHLKLIEEYGNLLSNLCKKSPSLRQQLFQRMQVRSDLHHFMVECPVEVVRSSMSLILESALVEELREADATERAIDLSDSALQGMDCVHLLFACLGDAMRYWRNLDHLLDLLKKLLTDLNIAEECRRPPCNGLMFVMHILLAEQSVFEPVEPSETHSEWQRNRSIVMATSSWESINKEWELIVPGYDTPPTSGVVRLLITIASMMFLPLQSAPAQVAPYLSRPEGVLYEQIVQKRLAGPLVPSAIPWLVELCQSRTDHPSTGPERTWKVVTDLFRYHWNVIVGKRLYINPQDLEDLVELMTEIGNIADEHQASRADILLLGEQVKQQESGQDDADIGGGMMALVHDLVRREHKVAFSSMSYDEVGFGAKQFVEMVQQVVACFGTLLEDCPVLPLRLQAVLASSHPVSGRLCGAISHVIASCEEWTLAKGGRKHLMEAVSNTKRQLQSLLPPGVPPLRPYSRYQSSEICIIGPEFLVDSGETYCSASISFWDQPVTHPAQVVELALIMSDKARKYREAKKSGEYKLHLIVVGAREGDSIIRLAPTASLDSCRLQTSEPRWRYRVFDRVDVVDVGLTSSGEPFGSKETSSDEDGWVSGVVVGLLAGDGEPGTLPETSAKTELIVQLDSKRPTRTKAARKQVEAWEGNAVDWRAVTMGGVVEVGGAQLIRVSQNMVRPSVVPLSQSDHPFQVVDAVQVDADLGRSGTVQVLPVRPRLHVKPGERVGLMNATGKELELGWNRTWRRGEMNKQRGHYYLPKNNRVPNAAIEEHAKRRSTGTLERCSLELQGMKPESVYICFQVAIRIKENETHSDQEDVTIVEQGEVVVVEDGEL